MSFFRKCWKAVEGLIVSGKKEKKKNKQKICQISVKNLWNKELF